MSDKSAAYRIPSELLDNIAQWALAVDDESEPWFTTGELVKLSFVCLRWAQLCRPAIWTRIRVKSEARHRAICAILDTTPPPSLVPVKDFIHELQFKVHQGNMKRPWLHAVRDVLTSKLTHTTSVELKITVHDNSIVRSFFPLLPRAPPIMHIPLTTLSLTSTRGYRFASRSALLRLLAAAPHLEVLVCYAISWVSNAPPAPSQAISSSLRAIYLDARLRQLDPDEVCWWLPPLIGHRSRTTSRDTRALQESSVLPDNELAMISSMLRRIVLGFEVRLLGLERDDKINTNSNYSHVFITLCGFSENTPGIRVEIYYARIVSYTSASAPAGLLSTRIVNIVEIKVVIGLRGAPRNLFSTLEDWGQILADMSHLPNLKCLSFKFEGRALQQDFIDKYGTVFDQAPISDKIAFSNTEDEKRRWFCEIYKERVATNNDTEATEKTSVVEDARQR